VAAPAGGLGCVAAQRSAAHRSGRARASLLCSLLCARVCARACVCVCVCVCAPPVSPRLSSPLHPHAHPHPRHRLGGRDQQGARGGGSLHRQQRWRRRGVKRRGGGGWCGSACHQPLMRNCNWRKQRRRRGSTRPAASRWRVCRGPAGARGCWRWWRARPRTAGCTRRCRALRTAGGREQRAVVVSAGAGPARVQPWACCVCCVALCVETDC
jgi:hypothetical protein